MKNPHLQVALAALLGYVHAYDRQPPFPPCDAGLYNIGGICCGLTEFNLLDEACLSECPPGWLAQGQVCVVACNEDNGFTDNGSGECVCSGTTPQNAGGICCGALQFSEWRYDPTLAGQYSIR